MIKAIETVYKGYRFRSRLEARWAVAFDAMGVHWQYEPEGFQLPSDDWYLPDFRVKSCGYSAWIEVKGGIWSDEEGLYEGGGESPLPFEGKEKTEEFSSFIMKKGGVVFLLGDIPDPDCKGEIKNQKNMFVSVRSDYRDEIWANCCLTIKDCESGLIYADYFFGSYDRYIIDGQKEEYSNGLRYRTWWPTEAYEKARSARFEHGETPR